MKHFFRRFEKASWEFRPWLFLAQKTTAGTPVIHFLQKSLFVVGLIVLNLSSAHAAPSDAAKMLWYAGPASRWLEALPVGNGRVGAMVFGGAAEEKLALNEITFWSGRGGEDHDNPKAPASYAKIRELFEAGKDRDAAPLIPNLLGRKLNYGTNLPAGDLLLKQSGVDQNVSDYRRDLDLETAIASVRFTVGGVHYLREVLASHPSGVLATRWTADRANAIRFSLGYQGGSFPWKVSTLGNDRMEIISHAFETEHSDGNCGVMSLAQVRVIAEGGTVTATADHLMVSGANAVTVLIAINTDFESKDPRAEGDRQMKLASEQGWDRLKAQHIADYQKLFHRVSLDLGPGRNDVPTDVRRAALAKGVDDPQLAALFFQYGRYLTIAGSREDSPLPMHLQGLWNDSLAATMQWTCDFHLDINMQQNYWPAEVCNLSECAEPLFHLVESLPGPGHQTARRTYGIDHGWVCHVFTNPWGFTAPGWGEGWGLDVTGGAWIATHLWEHYQFTGDRKFLQTRAYPVLKGAAEFFLDYLFVDPKSGDLYTGPSVSPERGGETTPGCTHDRAIIYDLFTACIESSKVLGVDADLRQRLEKARAKLPPYKIGRNGQLQEWMSYDDGGKTNHRHTSHLVGLFPLAQITPLHTPELAKAAAKSLQLRMDSPDWEDVEWSAGNAVCYYARLRDGDQANKNLINLLSSDTDADLLCYSRGGVAGAPQNIAVIDGNTSGTAGIAEMLLQSQNGEIALLPALPSAWPEGSVTGLRARGGFTVDIVWKKGTVQSYRIASPSPTDVKVRVNGKTIIVRSKPM